jgi:Protein of unknown function (DUF2946)
MPASRQFMLAIGQERRYHRSGMRSVFRRLAALVVMVAQIALGLAYSAESWRGADASAHIERTGTQLHHAHNEATCPACAAQSLHALVASRTPPVAIGRDDIGAAESLDDLRPVANPHTANGSRAPPVVS